MGCGKSTVLALRAMALIAVLGVAGVGAWCKYKLKPLQERVQRIDSTL